MSDPGWINADPVTGEPEYNAVELRRNQRMLLTGGVSDRLGARSGMHPAGPAAVTLAGQTITVHDSTCVIYPGHSSADGPYTAHFIEHTHALDPADGSNPRIDIVVARIYDDDHDASGRREAVTEYIAGTPAPSPSPPVTPVGALRIATIDVPTGGSPSPTLTYDAPFTVAAGGVLPVRDETEGPTAGRYHGMVRYRQDEDDGGVLEVWDGSAWRIIARPDAAPKGWTPIGTDLVEGVSAFTVDVTDGGRYPAGTFERLRFSGKGDTVDTAQVRMRVNNDTTAGLHRTTRFVLDASGAASAPDGVELGTSWFLATFATISSNNLQVELFSTHVETAQSYQGFGTRHSNSATAHEGHIVWGSTTAQIGPVSSLRILTDDGAGGPVNFGNVGIRWHLEGYRA